MDTKKITKAQIAKAQQNYSGMTADAADNDKVTAQEVKDDVKQLNNNPRNNDL